jgi:hypothetical protein
MDQIVVFECGQKRQRFAHFQDDPMELVGRDWLALVPSHRPKRNFGFRFRGIPPPQPDSNDVGNMAY